jgi:hypothetical protein
MPRIVVINHLTLDGVMQAPGRRDEARLASDRGARGALRFLTVQAPSSGVVIATYEAVRAT